MKEKKYKQNILKRKNVDYSVYSDYDNNYKSKEENEKIEDEKEEKPKQNK